MIQKRNRPRVLDVVTGTWSAQAVYVAAKLGIADMLTTGPRAMTDLAGAARVDPAGLHRVLRALASLGIFRLHENATVELTPSAEPLRSDHPDSLRQFAIMVNEELHGAFGGLLDAVRSGTPSFDKRFGMPIFQYYDTHPEVAATFHEAMNDWSNWDTPDIIEAYDFSRYASIVDVGGGNGAFLSALLARHPHLSGTLFDRPAAIDAARAGFGGPLPRCELVTGDMQIEVPKGGDLYTIKHVIDGWPDDGAAAILNNCRRAMADGGRVVVLDCVVRPGNDPSFIKLLDLLVMTTTPGRMRLESDYPDLFAAAGLRLSQVLPVSDSVTLLEGVVQ